MTYEGILEPRSLNAVGPQLPRSGTIESRWLVQSNEGVSIVPMAARHVMPIYDDD
jgi:hypothetical protein